MRSKCNNETAIADFRDVSFAAFRSSLLLLTRELSELGEAERQRIYGRDGDLDEMAEYCGQYLDIYYAKPLKKDSLRRRLRNAIHLLVQADRQVHSAATVALFNCIIDEFRADEARPH